MAKLIRDKIPEIIKKSGKTPATHVASEDEYWARLKEKLHEEVKEFCENDSEEEMADILEVIKSACEYLHFDRKELEALRKKKARERGGFSKRIILDSTG